MTDTRADDADKAWVDPERSRATEPFDQPGGRYGQQYDPAREAAEAEKGPSGQVGGVSRETAATDRDMPPDNGRRASFDPSTGEVHGSGVGAGGGAEGEDFSGDAATGDGYPLTGGEGTQRGAVTE